MAEQEQLSALQGKLCSQLQRIKLNLVRHVSRKEDTHTAWTSTRHSTDLLYVLLILLGQSAQDLL